MPEELDVLRAEVALIEAQDALERLRRGRAKVRELILKAVDVADGISFGANSRAADVLKAAPGAVLTLSVYPDERKAIDGVEVKVGGLEISAQYFPARVATDVEVASVSGQNMGRFKRPVESAEWPS